MTSPLSGDRGSCDRVVHPASPSSVIGLSGAPIARIPGSFATPRVERGGETHLADEIARFEPRLGQESRRASRRLGLGLIVSALVALAIIGAYLLVSR
jgi:hypothetical protein